MFLKTRGSDVRGRGAEIGAENEAPQASMGREWEGPPPQRYTLPGRPEGLGERRLKTNLAH